MKSTLEAKDRYLRLPEVLSMVGVEKSTWYKWIRAKAAPKQKRLSSRCSVWHLREIELWMKDPDEWRARNKEKAAS